MPTEETTLSADFLGNQVHKFAHVQETEFADIDLIPDYLSDSSPQGN